VVADAGQRLGTEVGANVDDRDPRPGDTGGVGKHEVGIAVAVGVDTLDVDDPPQHLATARELGGAARGGRRGRVGRGGAVVRRRDRALDPIRDNPLVVAAPGERKPGNGDRCHRDHDDRDDRPRPHRRPQM